MLKFFFWVLVIVNGALLAYHQGYLDSFIPSGHEPARVAQQLNADKIRLLPADAKPADQPTPVVPAEQVDKPAAEPGPDGAAKNDAAATGAGAATVAEAKPDAGKLMPVVSAVEGEKKSEQENKPQADAKTEDAKKADTVKADTMEKTASTDKKPEPLACTEIGNFNEADAGRFESRLAALTPGARLSRRLIRETTSYIVFMPSQGSKENADKKVEQLRALGVTDFYLIQDQSELRWGISLGIFSSEDSAKKRLEQLQQQGVRTARIGARNSTTKVAIQLRALDAAGREKLEKLKADFPQQQQRNCA